MPGEKREKKTQKKKVFLGVHLDPDVHQRLYRLKASLEYSTGKFYGLGKLLERVIAEGLQKVESTTQPLEGK